MPDRLRSEYLAELEALLPFPPDQRAEMVEEIAAHLEDAVAAGSSERQAHARLGAPAALADALSRPERRTVRLLAAAGAGVRASLGPAIYGYLLASFALLVAVLFAAGLATVVARLAGSQLTVSTQGGWNTAITAIPMGVALYFAARAATSAASVASRRLRRDVRPWVAVVGTAGTAGILLFLLESPQNLASVLALSIAPFGVAAGAYRPQLLPLWPKVPIWAIVGLLALIPIGILTSAVPPPGVHVAGEVPASEWQPRTEIVGPSWSPDVLTPAITSSGWSADLGGVSAEWQLERPGQLAGFTDLQLEAWHADVGASGQWRLDARYDAPFALGRVLRQATTLSGTVTVDRHPFVGAWELVLTGKGPDGVRYVLDTPGGGQSSFTGTAWDWALAVVDHNRQP